MNTNELLRLAIHAALKAGEGILKIYDTDFYVETKSDNTPVTAADKASGKTIEELLAVSGIPVISEEEALADYETRKHWPQVWIVDPLDGTKEFVKRNGEFAVNIALAEYGKPIAGVIYAPVLKELYFSAVNYGSFKLTQVDASVNEDSIFERAVKMPSQRLPKNYTVVASRSHLSREVNARIATLKNMYGTIDVVNVGSSIKQCWVADGRAHEYPRFGTTMEWDTAAGQCILEQIGGALLNFETAEPLHYNKPDMRNGYFIAKAVM